MSNTWKIAVSLAVIGGAAGYLMFSTMNSGEALTYFHQADEVMVKKKELEGQKIRLGGYVEECSILQKTGTSEYRFQVRPDHPHKLGQELKFPEMKGKLINVTFKGAPPDTFKDNAEVIVTG